MASIPAAVLHVLVTANTGGASASLTRLDRRLKTTATAGEEMGTRVARGAKYGAVALAAGAGAAVYAAAKYESAFAEVRKTVDTTEKGFDRISKGLLDLSEKIPVTANELAGLAGEAGALGVKSKDIVRFTKTASQLGTTTDLAATDAANALARLSNIMDTEGKTAFQRMGSTLVDLGNKGASTEAEISDMALRIAGAGKTIGLTEAQVLGLSSALANVGIRSEMGGSAISRVMLEMQDAIARGGADLKAFAKVSGVSVKEFQQGFERDAPAAIARFATGLGDINKAGGSTIETLKGVNLNEIRVRDTLLRLAGNTKNFTEAQDIANKAWGENNALAEEAKERYNTLESQLRMLGNSAVRSGIDIGTKLLPDIKALVAIMRDPKLTLSEKMAKVGERIGDMVAKWGPEVAEAGGQLGIQLVRGLGQAFLDSNIWGKLIIGGALVRAIGGKGAVTALGKKLGVWIAAPMSSTVAALAAERMGAGAIAGKWEGLGKTIGRLMGPVAATWFIYEFLKQTRNQQDDVANAIKNKTSTQDFIADQLGISSGKAGKVMDFAKGKGFTSYEDALEAYERANKDTAGRVKNIHRTLQGDLTKIADKTADNLDGLSKKQGQDVTQNTNRMVRAVGEAFGLLRDNTNKALKAYGSKPLNFAVDLNKSSSGGAFHGFQRGGAPAAIVPGTGTGDSETLALNGVPIAKVEPREGIFVGNRNMMASLDYWNKKIPRFQTGGMAGGISNLAGSIAKRFGLTITSGYRGGDPGYHGQGLAADLSDGFAPTPAMNAASRYIQSSGIASKLLEGIYSGSPHLSIKNGQQVSPSFWGAGTWAAHGNHIHLALSGALGPVAQAQALKSITLNGPAGPLRSMGQGAIDKAHAAAKTYLNKQMPKMAGPHSSPIGNTSGSLQKIAQRMIEGRWGAGQWPYFNDLVQRESGWNPRAVNPSSGAAGLAQALPPSKYPPGAWPYTGKDSAVKQLQWMVNYVSERYGNPAGAIAFHNANNWYQRGGQVMPSLDTGGRVTRSGLAEVHPGDVHMGKGAPIVKVTVIAKGSVEIEDVRAEINDAAVDIAEYAIREGGRGAGRTRQLARG